MNSEINNVKCAQHMLHCTEGVDFPKTRKQKYSSAWISTKDKLPDKSDVYICCMQNGHNDFGVFEGFFIVATFQKFGNHGQFYSRCQDITHDVLLWTPLPKLPDESST